MRYSQLLQKEYKEQQKMLDSCPLKRISQSDIEDLPPPIQRYLQFTKVIGKPYINSVRLKYEGSIRINQRQKRWWPLKAEQRYTINPPTFLWSAKIRGPLGIPIYACEKYSGGKGHFLGKIWKFLPLGNMDGEILDKDHHMRFLQEMCWYPTAYLMDYIQWSTIDINTAKVTMTLGNVTESAIITVNQRGEITHFAGKKHLDDRHGLPQNAKRGFNLWDWVIEVKKYKEWNGFNIPWTGNGTFKTELGDFNYIKVELKEISFDNL